MLRQNEPSPLTRSLAGSRQRLRSAVRLLSLALILLGGLTPARGQITGDVKLPAENANVMSVTGIPRNLQTIHMTVSAPPGSLVLFALGTRPGLVTLPFGVLLIEPESILANVVVTADATGEARMDLPLRRLRNDARFVTQAAFLDPSGSLSLTNSFHIAIQGDIAGSWSAPTALATSRGALAAETLSDGIHVLGGAETFGGSGRSQAHDVYDPEADSWSSRAPLPDTDTWGIASTVVGGKIYALGGWPEGGSSNRVYDPATDSWSYQAEIPYTFSWGQTVSAIGDQIYVIGLGRTWAYDVQTDVWTQRSIAPATQPSLASAVLGNRIYVVGEGQKLFIYDSVTDTWSDGPDLPISSYGPSVAEHGGKLYVFGGYSAPSLSTGHGEVQEYDPNAETPWRILPGMSSVRSWSAAATLNNRIYVFGGFDTVGYAINAVEDVR